jgi:hypothetical protein
MEYFRPLRAYLERENTTMAAPAPEKARK